MMYVKSYYSYQIKKNAQMSSLLAQPGSPVRGPIPGDLALRSSLETKGPAGGRDCLQGEDLPWQDMNFTHWIAMEGNSKENCYLKTEKLTYHKVNKQTSPAIISFAVLYYFNVKVGWKAASQLFRILAAHISVHSFPKKFWKHISKHV